MRFLATVLSALALVAGLNTAPALAQHPMMGRPMMNHHCGRHMTWVNGYRTRSGRWVAGHCRAMPMMHR